MWFNESLAHMELLHTVHELLEEQDKLRNERQLNDNESELKWELDTMRVEYNRLQNKMKDDRMTYEQDTNKQMWGQIRQNNSVPHRNRELASSISVVGGDNFLDESPTSTSSSSPSDPPEDAFTMRVWLT